MNTKDIRKEFYSNVQKVYSQGKAIPMSLCKREDVLLKLTNNTPRYVYPPVTKIRKHKKGVNYVQVYGM